MKESGADIGFAVDPDVDRLALVADGGRAIGEDFTLALAARVVLRHRPGPLVTNLSTSQVVEDAAREAVLEVLDNPAYRANAERVRAEIVALPGPEEAVQLLERLATTGEPQLART